MRLLALLALAGCPEKGADKELTAHVPDREKAIAASMSDWMPKDADQAWQGAWLVRLVEDGPIVAAEVTGDKAKIFDGVEEKEVAFKVIEPCAVAFGPHEIQFLIRDGKVVSGRGAAGMRKGETAVVCGDGRDPGAPEEGVYIVVKNRCSTWKRDAKGAWSQRDGVCVWANARGDDLLDVGTEHYSSTLVVKGDFLEERAFTKSAQDHMRATSWDAAKTTVTGNIKPPSKLEAAKAAGGVVGDHETIAGLHATYANNPQPLVGVDIEVAGVLVETSARSSRGKVAAWLVVIADPANPKAMQLVCETTADVSKVKPGERVVLKGVIDTRQDHARLRQCTVTAAP